MVDIGCDEPQVRGMLALYVAGQMPDSEQWELEEHLARCAECSHEAEVLGEAVAALTMLGAADRRGIVAEFGVPVAAASAPSAPSTKQPGGRPSAPPSRGEAGRRPRSRPPGTTGPASRSGGAVRRRPLLAAGAGLVMVLVLAAGIGLGHSVLFGSESSVVLVADSEGSANGAVLSVTVSRDGGDNAVRATISGLRPGESYRFYITDVGGNSYDMAGFSGAEQAQDVTTECPVPLDRLDRFSVTAGDGALVVEAKVNRGDRAPAPPD